MSKKTAVFRKFIRQNKFFNVLPVVGQDRGHDQKYEWSQENNKKFKQYRNVAVALFGSVLIGSAVTDSLDFKTKAKGNTQKINEAGQVIPNLPTYRAEEVSKHDTKESFWVTYKHGVYDVTKFLVSHPGGDQILNAGGLSIEPYWSVYGMHNTKEIHALLETFRIGNLHSEDVVDHSSEELWAVEPARDGRLIVHTHRPFNAETPAEYLATDLDTPNELFYVRQHMPVPELSAESHQISVTVVSAGNKTSKRFSLKQLKQFKTHQVRATLMCAGNRRSEMNKVKEVKGLSWSSGAIGTARWEGVLLRDVLIHCGVQDEDIQGKHVIFRGADLDATGENFSTSIPLHMALDPGSRILLATHMNGQPLPRDHGYPLRVVVPGAPAVRSVKWLESITVSTEESPGHWHQRDYRSFSPSVTWETADWPNAPPVYSLPVTSVMTSPTDGSTVRVEDGHITVKGYAYSGGGAKIVRVEVKGSRGEWTPAERLQADPAPPRRHYAWTLWETTVPVTPGQKEMEIWVKATDSNFNTQPENFEDIWNIRGILSNAYHKIKVQLKH